jgi:hypothetical protein
MEWRWAEGARLSMRDFAVILVAALATTGATYYLGWQRELARVDPALVLPWLVPFFLPLCYYWRGLEWRKLGFRLMALGLLIIAGQLGLYMAQVKAGALGLLLPQILVLSVGVALAAAVAFLLRSLFTRKWALGAASALLMAPLWFVISHIALDYLYAPRAVGAEQPPVAVMTSLPLRWSGGGDMAAILSGEVEDDPALTALQALGPVQLVDSLIGANIKPRTPLLLLHPRAMAPEELVAVDAHVRAGGRMVIFADALSSWHAPFPLGDARNPPITSLLTPLLDHWQITLSGVPHGQAGERWVRDGNYGLRLLSAGRFSEIPSYCEHRADGYLIDCNIGSGEVTLVGDADLLQAELWQADASRSRHLMKSDVFLWLSHQIWGDMQNRSWLGPLWADRQR